MGGESIVKCDRPHEDNSGKTQHLTIVFPVRMFVVQQIPESNLLMLVVQGDCDCSRQFPPITLEPMEVQYILLISTLGCNLVHQ